MTIATTIAASLAIALTAITFAHTTTTTPARNVHTATVPIAAPAAPAIPPELTNLVHGLASDDFTQREDAQRQLQKVAYRQLALLRQLVQSTSDDEVRSRLQKRIADFTDHIATDPPAVSLELKNAGFDNTLKALSAATGMNFDPWPLPSAHEFTISAQSQPFWNVFAALSRQHGLSFPDPQKLRIMINEPGWKNITTSGPVAVIPSAITRSIRLQSAPNPDQPQQMKFLCTFAVDPRIQIVQYYYPLFTEILDDAGNVLYKDTLATHPGLQYTGSRFMFDASTDLSIPNRPGKKIASAKGVVRLVAQTAVDHLVVVDPEKPRPLEVGDCTFVISDFEARDNHLNFRLEGRNSTTPDLPTVTLTFTDATDKQVYVDTVPASFACGIDLPFVAPLKLEIAVVLQTKELVFPFELKDLPLP